MRKIVRRERFLQDLRQLKRRGLDIHELLDAIDLLAEDGELPASYNPHMLTGEWRGIWECHIEPDWLLIYETTDTEVLLHRTGSHQYLFG
jgi:mRNA interferase YafQ